MSKTTDIQWCYSTINPIMGCAGCPLWPNDGEVIAWLVKRTAAFGCTRPYIEIIWSSRRLPDRVDTMCAVIEALADRLDGKYRAQCRALKVQGRKLFRCYAGHVTRRFADKSAAYPKSFESPQVFPGRVAESATWGDPSPTERARKPWLGKRRLIFLSDMGDALSEGIEFDTLLTEVIEPIIAAKSSPAMWLWLTKRPKRMAKFAAWLAARNIAWPQNLVPMCSIISQHYANVAQALLEIPAVAHGFSCEPWSSWVELPDALFTRKTWVILGGESGGAIDDHPFDISWARRLRDRCAAGSTSFFLKQLGGNPTNFGSKVLLHDRHGGMWDEWPTDLRVREVPQDFL